MAEDRVKTRSLRRKQVRLPGSKTVTHFIRRRPASATCAGCGKDLLTVPRVLPKQMQKLGRVVRRPSRPFGGFYCSPCMRVVMIAQAREQVVVSESEVV